MCFDPGADLTAADLAAAWSDEPGDLVVDDRAVPRDTPLVDCGLADGATVAVGRAPVVRPRLVVVAGPVPSIDVPIDGTVLIGRGAACDLRLDHPSIRPAHALVEGTTACSLDGATWLDGVPLHGPQPLRAGSVLSVGAVDLQVLGEDPPAVVTPPRSPVHRAARPPDEAVADPGPAPEPPPETPPPSPPGVLTVVGPLVVGVVLAVLVHPTAGLVTVGWPIIAVGSHLDARRRHRRDGRTADAAHAEAVDAHRRAAEDTRRHEADRERRNFPTIVDALHRARSGVGLWPVRDAARPRRGMERRPPASARRDRQSARGRRPAPLGPTGGQRPRCAGRHKVSWITGDRGRRTGRPSHGPVYGDAGLVDHRRPLLRQGRQSTGRARPSFRRQRRARRRGPANVRPLVGPRGGPWPARRGGARRPRPDPSPAAGGAPRDRPRRARRRRSGRRRSPCPRGGHDGGGQERAPPHLGGRTGRHPPADRAQPSSSSTTRAAAPSTPAPDSRT